MQNWTDMMIGNHKKALESGKKEEQVNGLVKDRYKPKQYLSLTVAALLTS